MRRGEGDVALIGQRLHLAVEPLLRFRLQPPALGGRELVRLDPGREQADMDHVQLGAAEAGDGRRLTCGQPRFLRAVQGRQDLARKLGYLRLLRHCASSPEGRHDHGHGHEQDYRPVAVVLPSGLAGQLAALGLSQLGRPGQLA